jgi:hypothetical protein
MIAGWEALIVQRDVCGLSAAEHEELSVSAARALLHAAKRARRAYAIWLSRRTSSACRRSGAAPEWNGRF